LIRAKVLLVPKIPRQDFFSKGVLEKKDEEKEKDDVNVDLKYN